MMATSGFMFRDRVTQAIHRGTMSNRSLTPWAVMNTLLVAKSSSTRMAIVVSVVLLWCALVSKPLIAETINPLAPPDLSSPRATFFSFMRDNQTRWELLIGPKGYVTEYLASTDIFFDQSKIANLLPTANFYRDRVGRYLDTSGLAEEMRNQLVWRLVYQLLETLCRVDLPKPDQVPGKDEVEDNDITSWTVPGTEIKIVKVDKGPHAGEFLFSAETVAQIPVFYERSLALEPRKGAPTGLYDFVFHTPSGVAWYLDRIIPPRWFYSLPASVSNIVLDQPLWRWVSLSIVFVVYLSTFMASAYYIRKRRRNEQGQSTAWTLLPSAVLIVTSPFTTHFLDEVLRLTPYLFTKIDPFLWSVFYGALTIFTWRFGGLLADWLIHYERLQKSSLDEQIIRLVVRLITIFLSMGVLVSGANRLGVPVYSVMAGLGIGGLAAALAGQQTLANLFGSLIIMLEKPFRVGHMIRAGGFEGTVDEVGFRSARIITRDNTPLTVPCSTLVNQNIENLTLRQYWHVKHLLHFVVSTPVEDIHAYVNSVKTWVESRDDVRHQRIKICLIGLGLHGYEVLVDFSVKARDEIDFFYKQDKILFKLAEMAREQGVALEHPVY